MTTEEKANAYDEALKKAKKILDFYKDPAYAEVHFYANEDLHFIFPELAESEDERIRKGIIEYLEQSQFGEEHYQIDDDIVRNYIAWLEKQGEKGTNGNEREIPFSEHKIKPKFKVGDWVLYDTEEWREVLMVDRVDDGIYHLVDVNGDTCEALFEEECNMRLWDIGDARDGDVLYCKKRSIDDSETVMMYAGINVRNHVDSYCRYNSQLGFNMYITNVLDVEHDFITPATKEQRDLLFQKMKEAGYELNFVKKQLKKIEQ